MTRPALPRRATLWAGAGLLTVTLSAGLAPGPAAAGPAPAAAPAAAPPAAAARAPAPDAPEFPAYVMQRLDDMHRGGSSHGVLEMHVKTRHWTRTLEMESWSLGKDYSLVRILLPRKERGSATLKSRSDLFTYLNQTGSTIKITGGMMGSSWMGSHFTNDDLVRETRLGVHYDIRRLPDGEEGGQPAHRFALTPRPSAPVVWGRIEVAVRKGDLAPLSELFFDEDGKKVRAQEFADFRLLAGQIRPMRMVMRPLDGSDEFTALTVKQLELDIPLDPGFFSVIRLKAG